MTTEDKRLEKVRALLAKAEASDFPAEAAALTAKANDLIVAWAIDSDALAGALNAINEGAKVDSITIDLPGRPYTMPHSNLVNCIGINYGCKVVSSTLNVYPRGVRNIVTVVGLDRDLAAVQILYTSLLLQAQREMNNSRPGAGNGVAYRNAFMLGYASLIHTRLAVAKREREDAAVAQNAGMSLMLSDRSRMVEDRFKELFPRTRTTHSSAGNGRGAIGGRAAGAAAASRANLNASAKGIGSRKALTS